MGNQDSRLGGEIPQPVENLQIAHLGAVTLMRTGQSHCFLKVFTFTDNFAMQERQRRLRARVGKVPGNAHILDLYSLSRLERKELCANNYQLHVFLQQPERTLGQLIAHRLRQKNNFSQEEIFQFLAKAVASLIYIQDNGLKNIQIDAQAILLCGQNVKILDSGIATSKTYYQLLDKKEKGLSFSGGSMYIAPELLKELKELNYDPYISPKADIFSIGMLLLQMVTLQPMYCYYDYTLASIDYDSLIHRLSRISHTLSLKTLIAEMLEYDPEERIGLVSLREKIQKLRNAQIGQQITRSKSSKMLKELLSQSRKSGSLSRQGEGSCSLSRQPSTERKNNSRIQLHCNSGKKDILRESERKAQVKDKKEELKKDNSTGLSLHTGNAIDQVQFKNLVKNRLVKQKQKNKQNSQASTSAKNLTKFQEIKCLEQKMLLQRNSNRFDSLNTSNSSNKINSTGGAKFFQITGGFIDKVSLYKNTEEFQSMKNTSRFGNGEGSQVKEKNKNDKNVGLRRISEIYIREQEASECEQPLITVRQPVSRERQLQKVMTFNNKQFLISARSVEASVEKNSPSQKNNQQKLTFSPIMGQCCEQCSPEDKMTIKDVPIVISQQKVYQLNLNPQNFGRLQRNLHLLDCAQSIQQDSLLNDANNINSSKVIESFKPNPTFEENYKSVGITTSKVQSYNRQNSCFLKKAKPKKPDLNIQLYDQDQEGYLQVQSYQSRENQQKNNETPYQRLPKVKSKLAKLEQLYKTSQSIEHLSNFTSISPPQDSKDSNSTFQALFQQGNFLNTNQLLETSTLKKIILNNGDSYQGQISAQGLPNGNGILQSTSEFYQYSGSFKDGKFHGYGTLLNRYYRPQPIDHKFIDLSRGYWSRFEGQFDNGTKNGFGTIYFQEGQKFSGCLKRDVIQGYGCFYKKNGELISGLWNDNKFKKI